SPATPCRPQSQTSRWPILSRPAIWQRAAYVGKAIAELFFGASAGAAPPTPALAPAAPTTISTATSARRSATNFRQAAPTRWNSRETLLILAPTTLPITFSSGTRSCLLIMPAPASLSSRHCRLLPSPPPIPMPSNSRPTPAKSPSNACDAPTAISACSTPSAAPRPMGWITGGAAVMLPFAPASPRRRSRSSPSTTRSPNPTRRSFSRCRPMRTTLSVRPVPPPLRSTATSSTWQRLDRADARFVSLLFESYGEGILFRPFGTFFRPASSYTPHYQILVGRRD